MPIKTPRIADLSLDELLEREWLITNHLGGYASSTIAGLNTRKYHGLLVAALLPPVKRTVILSRVEEYVQFDGRIDSLASNEYPGVIFPEGHKFLAAFDPQPFPRWAYRSDDWTIEKGVRLVRGQNTVVISYTLLGGVKGVTLEIRPLMGMRPMHELVYQSNLALAPELCGRGPQHYRIAPTPRTPEAFISHDGTLNPAGIWYINHIYRREAQRGYPALEDLWSPCVVRWDLTPGQTVHFVCSTEPTDFAQAVAAANDQAAGASRSGPSPRGEHLDVLISAASRFVARVPAVRVKAMLGETSAGSESTPRDAASIVTTEIPWGSPDIRSGLIAMPGLLLSTGQFDDADRFLRLAADLRRSGVVPSSLLEDASGASYIGADTSLWLIHSASAYFRAVGPGEPQLRWWLSVFESILEDYVAGRASSAGVTIDSDGLLVTRLHGQPTTWMNARTDGSPVTGRDGRPVEVNALWYNALRITADLSARLGRQESAERWIGLAERVKDAFGRRFWNEGANCLFDVVRDAADTGHGGQSDGAIRPNQLFAIGLEFSLLDNERGGAVLEVVRGELLTALGVRTLSPRDPAYRGRYGGDAASRDAAYHQGTAYPWLLGVYVSALLRVRGRCDEARSAAMRVIEPCIRYMEDRGTGMLPELFDGDPPHHPGGAVGAARSVGEVLRVYADLISN